MIWLAYVWLLSATTVAHADGTWIEQADAALTCTALADPGEVAQISAPSVP